MKPQLLAWLAQSGSWAWHTALGLLFLLNGAAFLALIITRSRVLVDRWTPRWLTSWCSRHTG